MALPIKGVSGFRFSNLVLSVFVLCALFFCLELACRRSEPPEEKIPLHLLDRDASYVYSLNPAHPEINRHGLRGPDFTIPKPDDVYRIMVLGDSVTYGLFVEEAEAYPRQLEKLLNQGTAGARGKRIEVLNGGVNGYTTYNQLKFFEEKGRSFQPDLVIAAFCLNDVVDPVRHWGDPGLAGLDLPGEAFADYNYYREQTVPLMTRKKGRIESKLEGFALYRFVKGRLERFRDRNERYQQTSSGKLAVYLADESPLKITALSDPLSPQWKWTSIMLGKLESAVRSAGADFAIVVLPLAYQLEPGYPYLPQENFEVYCREKGLSCLDLLPVLSGSGEKMFMGSHRYHREDIWHLSAKGHRKTAEALYGFVDKNFFDSERDNNAIMDAKN